MTRFTNTRTGVGRGVRGLTVTALSILFGSSACSTFDGLSVAKSRADERDAAVGTQCRHARGRPPPTIVSVPDEAEFVVAVRSLDFGEPSGGAAVTDVRTIGFDLDGKCTGEGEGPSCLRPPWADPHPDGVDGRDNAASSLIDLEDGGRVADQSNMETSLGGPTMVIRIRRYNSSLNDSDIDVALFSATRSHDPPLWNGKDEWDPFVEWTEPAADADLAGGVPAKYESSRAYVNDGTLVAHFPSARGVPEYDFSDAWIQARIDSSAISEGRLSLLDGTFTGRLRLDDALAAVEFVPDPETGGHTCMDSKRYPDLKRQTCALADIGFEGDDPAVPCNAISWAWKFEAEPAMLAHTVVMVRASDVRTCPGAVSPTNDSCSTLD